MKAGIRTAALTTLMLASPALSFGGGQPPITRTPTQSEVQDRTGITKAVQSGKGTGITRNDGILSGNAYRSQTAADNGTVKKNSGAPQPNYSDPAFRK